MLGEKATELCGPGSFSFFKKIFLEHLAFVMKGGKVGGGVETAAWQAKVLSWNEGDPQQTLSPLGGTRVAVRPWQKGLNNLSREVPKTLPLPVTAKQLDFSGHGWLVCCIVAFHFMYHHLVL